MNTPPPSDRIKEAVSKLLTPLPPPTAPAVPTGVPAQKTINVRGNNNIVAMGNITLMLADRSATVGPIETTLDATYQVAALLDALLAAAVEPTDDQLKWAVRGLVPRLQQLNCVLMQEAAAYADAIQFKAA